MFFQKINSLLNLNNYFYSSFEDQTYLGTFSWWSKVWNVYSSDIFFNPLLGLHGFRYEITNTNQPLIWYIVSIGYYIFEQNFFYNLFVLATFALNFVSAYKVFTRLTNNSKGVATIQAIAFSFSPYVVIHSGRHLDLSIVALIPWFCYYISLLFDQAQNAVPILKRLFLITLVQTLISNYYGYFMLLTTVLATLIKILLYIRNIPMLLKWVRLITVYYALLLGTLITILLPYAKSIYLKNSTDVSTVQYTRPLDDFITFSARPWFFLLPPATNPITGSITTYFLKRLNNSKSYFLFNDYFIQEHGGNFLGYTNFILFIVAINYWIKSKYNLPQLLSMLGLALALVIISMPPYFTVNMHTVYTPSFVLYKVFPMFRSINRLSIFILFILLMINARYLASIQIKTGKWFLGMLLFILVALTIDYAYPIRIQNVGKQPEIYKYIADNLPIDAQIAFYPSRKSAIYWTKVFQRKYINPDGYVSDGFNADKFTKQLPSPIGIKALQAVNTGYLVVFRDAPEQDRKFFADSTDVVLVAETPEAVIYLVNK